MIWPAPASAPGQVEFRRPLEHPWAKSTNQSLHVINIAQALWPRRNPIKAPIPRAPFLHQLLFFFATSLFSLRAIFFFSVALLSKKVFSLRYYIREKTFLTRSPLIKPSSSSAAICLNSQISLTLCSHNPCGSLVCATWLARRCRSILWCLDSDRWYRRTYPWISSVIKIRISSAALYLFGTVCSPADLRIGLADRLDIMANVSERGCFAPRPI